MYGYVYLTINLVNGKKYIGQHRSNKLDESYLGSGKLLQKAVAKYGPKNFTVEILEECDSEDDLNNSEIYYISLYDAVNDDDFYNIARGGEGHTCEAWNKGLKGVYKPNKNQLAALEHGRHLPSSDKHKAQLSARRKGCVVSQETRDKIVKANTGRKHSDEFKAKHRELMLGENNPNFGGISDEHRENLRKSSSGRVHIHKDTDNKNVKKELLDTYLNEGWQLGYYYK